MSDFLQEGDLSNLDFDTNTIHLQIVQSDLVDINITPAETALSNQMDSAAEQAVAAHKAAGKPINGKTVW